MYLQRTVEGKGSTTAPANEILIAAAVAERPAQHVETFEVSGQGSGQARMHAAFVQAHGSIARAPFVQLAPWNWERPWQM